MFSLSSFVIIGVSGNVHVSINSVVEHATRVNTIYIPYCTKRPVSWIVQFQIPNCNIPRLCDEQQVCALRRPIFSVRLHPVVSVWKVRPSILRVAVHHSFHHQKVMIIGINWGGEINKIKAVGGAHFLYPHHTGSKINHIPILAVGTSTLPPPSMVTSVALSTRST